MTGFDALPPVPDSSPFPLIGGDGWEQPNRAAPAGTSFSESLDSALRGLTELQDDAHAKAMALARGEPVQLHDVLVAMGKSEVAFNLAIEVRNRLVQAWETLSRTVV